MSAGCGNRNERALMFCILSQMDEFRDDELLRMDWLCDNISGSIPEYEDVLPFAQPLVRALGLHRERIPVQKEDLL